MVQYHKCFMKDCKRKAKLRFTGGDEAVLCNVHWKAVKEVTNEMRKNK